MEGTLVPLSIAFMDSEGRIVDIQDMEPLDDAPPGYVPAEPAQYALEVNQGFFVERGVRVGDTVELPRPGSTEPPGSAEVVQAFRDAGLEVGEPYPVEQELGWGARPVPRTYGEGTRFLVPSLGEDAGGGLRLRVGDGPARRARLLRGPGAFGAPVRLRRGPGARAGEQRSAGGRGGEVRHGAEGGGLVPYLLAFF